MKLYLEHCGRSFADIKQATESDMGYARFYLMFIDRDGKRVYGNVSCYSVRESYYTKRGNLKSRVLSEDGLLFDLFYETHKSGCGYLLETSKNARYTQADVLRYVNSVSAIQYDGVEIVDRLPEEPKNDPIYQHALRLEQRYITEERAALLGEIRKCVVECPLRYMDNLPSFARDWWNELSQWGTENEVIACIAYLTKEYATAFFGDELLKKLPKMRYNNAQKLYHWIFAEQQYVSLYRNPALLRLLREEYPELAAPYMPRFSYIDSVEEEEKDE